MIRALLYLAAPCVFALLVMEADVWLAQRALARDEARAAAKWVSRR